MIELRNGYWAVELPEGAEMLRIGKSVQVANRLYFDVPYAAIERQSIDLPPGTWEIICTCKEATEEQAVGIVDSSQWYFPIKHTRYVDYAFPFDREFKQRWDEGFGEAIESFNSLLASKGCNLNKTYLILKKNL